MRKLLVLFALALTSCTPDGSVPTAATFEPIPPGAETPEPAAEETGEPTPEITPTPPPSDFDVDAALGHARVLSVDIGNRMSGTDGDEQAANYIRDVLESYGLEAEMRPFPLPQGGNSWNVVGTPPGFDPGAGRYLIVGGHYDSLNGPGANDNASGIGVVLDVARSLRDQAAALPVIVVAFGAEERQPVPGPRQNHIGSRTYVDAMSPAEREHLVAFVNVDMVGRGDGLFCARMDQGPREATQRLVALAPEHDIPCRERVTPDWSDNGPFLRNGMNTGWLWAGEDPAFHSPRDTFDRLQRQPIAWAGHLTLLGLRSYD